MLTYTLIEAFEREQLILSTFDITTYDSHLRNSWYFYINKE